jgi:hypothetical protein
MPKAKAYWVCISKKDLQDIVEEMNRMDAGFSFLKMTDNGDRKVEDGEIRLSFTGSI